jgi:hypothetical protein
LGHLNIIIQLPVYLLLVSERFAMVANVGGIAAVCKFDGVSSSDDVYQSSNEILFSAI